MDDVLKSKYEEAIWIAKALFQHRIITGTTGNISFLHNKKMYITKSGSCLGKLDMDSFAITDLNGNILFNKPSKEYIMHLALYNSNETYKAIIHTHSFYTTLLSYNNHSHIDTPYMKLKNEKLKYIDYFPPGSKFKQVPLHRLDLFLLYLDKFMLLEFMILNTSSCVTTLKSC